MTQAARAQEPSMEEILASIRRIIADDDANKGAAAAKPVAPSAPAPAPPPAPDLAPPVIEAAVLEPIFPAAELDAFPEPALHEPALDLEPAAEESPASDEADILDLTDPMEAADAIGFRTIEPSQDLVFDEPAAAPAALETADLPIGEVALPDMEVQPEPMAMISEPPPVSTVDMARRQFERDTGEDRSLLSTTTTAAVDAAFNSLAQTVLVQNSRTLDDLVREMLRPMLKAWLDDNLPNMVERLVRAEIERVSRGRG